MVSIEEFMFFLHNKGLLSDVDTSLIDSFIKEQHIGSSEVNMMDKIYERAKVGYAKYGVNTDRTDLTKEEWITHFQEELLDAYIYASKIKQQEDIEEITKINEMCDDEVLIKLEELFTFSNIDYVWALAKHLDLNIDDLEEIEVEDGNYISYKDNRYIVCTDKEADKLERERLESIIDECYLPYIPEDIRYIVENHLDIEGWIDDWSGHRGENLNTTDGREYEQEINGVTYYIYY